VEGQVVVEVKAAEKILNIHLAQVMTYLKLSKRKVGLLLNFNALSMKNGIRRVAV
jgi:GxxExxY protein